MFEEVAELREQKAIFVRDKKKTEAIYYIYFSTKCHCQCNCTFRGLSVTNQLNSEVALETNWHIQQHDQYLGGMMT